MRDLREHRQRKESIKACSVCLAFLAIFAMTGRQAGEDYGYDDTTSAPFLMSTVLDRPMPGAVTENMSLRQLIDPTAEKLNDHKFVKYANYWAAEEREMLKAVITQAVTEQEHNRDPYYYMHEKVVYPSSKHLNRRDGVCYGPSGRETYYNLDMRPVVQRMRSLGYSAKDYPYWVRSDGVKMLGPYVMVAANFRIRPRGTILECSLGTAIVCDTGGFIRWAPRGLDVAVNW